MRWKQLQKQDTITTISQHLQDDDQTHQLCLKIQPLKTLLTSKTPSKISTLRIWIRHAIPTLATMCKITIITRAPRLKSKEKTTLISITEVEAIVCNADGFIIAACEIGIGGSAIHVENCVVRFGGQGAVVAEWEGYGGGRLGRGVLWFVSME